MKETGKSIVVEDRVDDIVDIVSRYVSDDHLVNQIAHADVIVVPFGSVYGYEGPVFPEYTRSLLEYIRSSSVDRARIDIAISDDDYVEHAERSDVLILPTILIAEPEVRTVIVNAVWSYILMYFRRQVSQLLPRHRVTGELQISLQRGKCSAALKYSGPASEWRAVVESTLDGLVRAHEAGLRGEGDAK